VHAGWCRTELGTDAAMLDPTEGAALIVQAIEADVTGRFLFGDRELPW
jgi:hypothetical protein